MAMRDLPQVLVTSLFGGKEDRPDIHHNVDEERGRLNEGPQILPLLHKAHGHGLSRLDQQRFDPLRRSAQSQPAQVRREEEKAEIVHRTVILPILERGRIGHRPVEPATLPRPLCENEHHPRIESVAPVRPAFPVLPELTTHRVHWIIVCRIVFEQPANLPGGEIK